MISKKRFWGLALPIWVCQECGSFEVIGSKQELKSRAVEGWDIFEGHTPHRPWIDTVKIRCPKCGGLAQRIQDVGNPWLDAGIVSYSTLNYRHNREYWEKWFPAELNHRMFAWAVPKLVLRDVSDEHNNGKAQPVRGLLRARHGSR